MDFVPLAGLGVPGRLGLTCAPGKCEPGEAERDLDDDVRQLREEHGADLLVCLVERHELQLLRIEDLLARAGAGGLATAWFPIRDGSVPASRASLRGLLDRIVAALRAGRTVIIHCRGGLGRTGLVAAACLVGLGARPAEALAAVRAVRPGSAGAPEQERWVLRLEG
ncbi:MAG TPA: cyclin-dependent kinase inhibitor 3 family protein [Polyangia bacterium]